MVWYLFSLFFSHSFIFLSNEQEIKIFLKYNTFIIPSLCAFNILSFILNLFSSLIQILMVWSNEHVIKFCSFIISIFIIEKICAFGITCNRLKLLVNIFIDLSADTDIIFPDGKREIEFI